jgi:5-methyltetrahydropteroyltriglutamate--homocysteine methyltransferase
VEGFAEEFPVVEQTKPDGTKVQVEMHTKAVAGKLRQVRRLAQHEAAFLKQHAPGPWKITMPTPVRNRAALQPAPPAPYKSWDEVQQDLVDIFRNEMVALRNEGETYLQLDKVITAYANDESRERMKQQGTDPERALAAEIAYENQCYDAVRAEGMTLAMHLCRGNRTGWTGGVGGYDWPAEQLFNNLHADRFLLEFDTARAGGFEPLRYMPRGRVAMLGLVTTKSAQMEKQDELLRRIEEAAKYCPIDQLALGPQCGFQSAANRDGASMTIDDEKRKLELIVDTARKVWG